MQYLSALPRSDAEMGFYATAAERMPIARCGSPATCPPRERPRFQYRAADNPRFAAAIARRERPDAADRGDRGQRVRRAARGQANAVTRGVRRAP